MEKNQERIDFSKKFDKQLKKAPQEIVDAFRKRLNLFTQNPNDPQLHNHALTGNFKGYRSINITGDWRALFTETKTRIIFQLLGTHSQLYG